MGLPAEKLDQDRHSAVRPCLRLVQGKRAAASRRASGRAATPIAAELFRSFCFVIAVLAALAGGRVWLSAQAAEASVASGHLRQEIKAQRFVGDMLEIQASRLAAPSRVSQIAGKAMGMAQPQKVCYIDLGPSSSKTAEQRGKVAANTGLKGAVSSAMKLAAGEAQVLLVGDVGLATSR